MVWFRRLLTLILLAPGLLFIVLGLRWLVDPAGVAPTLGFRLESGFGLSSQVADLSSFFLVTGLSILMALVTRTATWYYPPILLLVFAAVGRLVAWLVHGAAFALQAIVVEIIVAVLLLVASRILPQRD